jgi:hypothetical protein
LIVWEVTEGHIRTLREDGGGSRRRWPGRERRRWRAMLGARLIEAGRRLIGPA